MSIQIILSSLSCFKPPLTYRTELLAFPHSFPPSAPATGTFPQETPNLRNLNIVSHVLEHPTIVVTMFNEVTINSRFGCLRILTHPQYPLHITVHTQDSFPSLYKICLYSNRSRSNILLLHPLEDAPRNPIDSTLIINSHPPLTQFFHTSFAEEWTERLFPSGLR